MYSYITLLSTNSYTIGVITLVKSLRKTNSKYPILCLITSDISSDNIKLLIDNMIPYQRIHNIKHPFADTLSENEKYKMYNYTKLRIFGLIEFKKIVFLDADMIILKNIDHLFERPHMSACNSGGEIEKYKGWKYFNSGLMVIDPSKEIYDDMISKVGKIETEKNKGDQAFLHAYYNDWPNKPKLHLPHVYNVLISHLQSYIDEHDYTLEHESGKTDIYVLHYVGVKKPWNIKKNSADYARILWHLNNL